MKYAVNHIAYGKCEMYNLVICKYIFIEQLKGVMCCEARPLTPDEVYNLFSFDYDGLLGSNLRQQEEAATTSLMFFFYGLHKSGYIIWSRISLFNTSNLSCTECKQFM